MCAIQTFKDDESKQDNYSIHPSFGDSVSDIVVVAHSRTPTHTHSDWVTKARKFAYL